MARGSGQADDILYGDFSMRDRGSVAPVTPQEEIAASKEAFKERHQAAKSMREELDHLAQFIPLNEDNTHLLIKAKGLVDDVLDEKRFGDLDQVQYEQLLAQREMEDTHFADMDDRAPRLEYLDQLIAEIAERGEDIVREKELSRMDVMLATAQEATNQVLARPLKV